MNVFFCCCREPTTTVRLLGRVTSEHSTSASEASKTSLSVNGVASNWLDLSVEVCKVDDANNCWDDANNLSFFDAAQSPQTQTQTQTQPAAPPPPPPASTASLGNRVHHHQQQQQQHSNPLDVLLGNPNLHNSSEYPSTLIELKLTFSLYID